MSDRAKVKIIPPVIPAISIALGGIIQFVYPVKILSTGMLFPLGIAMVVMSVLIVAAALKEIIAAKTAFDVRKTTTSLVTTGIFNYSRNPTYLSMMLLCFGVALIVNSLPILVTSALTGSALCLLVIRQEETYLQDKFGSQYSIYKGVVRRWA